MLKSRRNCPWLFIFSAKDLGVFDLSEALLDTYKCLHGFKSHFISLILTKNYYLIYKHWNNADEHRFFNLIEYKESY